ncbi:protein rhomboid-like [Ixodes scapularis]
MGSNIILQLAFGLPLEMVHSWWRVMIVYCSGVQCGPLAQFFFNPHVYLAGSSSGVYALQTAHLAHIVTNFRDMEFVWMRLLGLLFIYGNDLYWVLTGPQRRQGRYFSYADLLSSYELWERALTSSNLDDQLMLVSRAVEAGKAQGVLD